MAFILPAPEGQSTTEAFFNISLNTFFPGMLSVWRLEREKGSGWEGIGESGFVDDSVMIWAKYAPYLYLQRGKREGRTSVNFKWGICCVAVIRCRLFNPNER